MKTTYGDWTVLSRDKIYKNNKIHFLCRCVCGTEKPVAKVNLANGSSTSCGCFHKRQLIERNTKHNKRQTKEWRAWSAMKSRCNNPNMASYHNYGGRGITVFEEWKDSFISFYNHVGVSPEGTTLDRINTNGNYEPGNVRWATRKEQAQNKRNNNKIKGVCVTEISNSLGGSHSLVAKRLKRGWNTYRAITEKTNAKK